ncbi:hypothetical protein QYE76_057088 [Lolium multiflorum]|uniref:Uncharacterized protein n=1 Tax=Lolium multiflorum TaxID=4521 RepID=A0AAD8T3H1_LOLMU|nr:hypothetical protein QYE76_057088 [Lolium multiflorum]
MIIQTFYAGLNVSSKNLLDSAAGGTFMSLTLGSATKLLDDMMINYYEWHTERTPQGKKVNSVEETSSLSDKIDVIMSMLVNGRSNVDPNNVPLASLVAQEEHVDVNFIKSNNFNNNAYRNNFNNNYMPYPSNSGNSYNNSRSVPSGLEVMLKEFISTQTAFNKSVEEKLGKIDVLASKVDSLAADVDLLKLKVMPNEDKDIKSFATANAIQVRINDNIRMMAELHARWEREEKLAKENNVAKVWTITTTSNVNASHVAKPPTINGKATGWTDSLVLFNEALARLCGQNVATLREARFAHLARRNSAGEPMDLQSHPELKHHVEHLDFMLFQTQKELDNSRAYANQTHLALAQHADAIKMLAKDRKSLRQQRAKKDATIARLRANIVSLEATVKAQEDQMREMEDEGEEIQGGGAFLSDDDDFEEDENTDVEDYEFLEAGEDEYIPIDVDDE